MEDDNITPYQTTPSLTVQQAVMYMLGYRGQYSFDAGTEEIEVNLFEYLHNLQEGPDCAHGNATYELEMLKRYSNASPEALKAAEQKVESTKAELERAKNLTRLAEQYRLLIDHEIKRVRLGKRTPLVVDEDESARTGQPRILTASFQEWLDGMELDDAQDVSAPVDLPVEEDAFDRKLSRKSAESLHVTLGLLVRLFAESIGGMFGTGQEPTVINIAKELDKYAKQLNDGHPLHGQGTEAIKKRIEVALSALYSNT